jgi:hypothetical protein
MKQSREFAIGEELLDLAKKIKIESNEDSNSEIASQIWKLGKELIDLQYKHSYETI